MTLAATDPATVLSFPPDKLDAGLITNGYEPIVVVGKVPPSSGWSTRPNNLEAITADRTEHPEATNTGLRTGRLAGVDIDLHDPDHAVRVNKLTRERLGSTIERVGSKGAMFCYRNDDPIPKITISGKYKGQPERVEVLGAGQQFVAYGLHPDTNKQFRWTDADIDGEPLTTPLADLPEVTPSSLRDLAQAVATMLSDLGYSDVRISGVYTTAEVRTLLGDLQEDKPTAVAEAKKYLARRERPVEFAGSDDDCYKAATRLYRDLGLSFETTLELIGDWSGFDEDWIAEKILNASHDGQNQRGCDIPLTPTETHAGLIAKVGAQRHGEPEKATGKAADIFGDDDPTGSGKLSFADAMAQLGLDLAAVGHQRAPDPPRLLAFNELMVSDDNPATYLWDGWVLEQEVNPVYGDGKTGKTMLSLHLAIARAAGIDLFGKAVKPGAVMIVTTEDRAGPIKFAVKEICAELGVDTTLPLPIMFSCRPRIDTTLADISDDGSWQPGAFLRTLYEDVRKLTTEHGECLVILDPLVNFATLNENLRPPAHTLCQVVLSGLCDYLGATVVIDAHPSETQRKSGRGGSGNTGWRNAVRNMLILEKDDPLDGHDPARTLRNGGANYGSAERLHLNLEGPVFSVNRDWRPPQDNLTALETAAILLNDMLRDCPSGMTMEELVDEGKGRNPKVTEITMRRAIKDLKLPIKSTRGVGAKNPPWYWKWAEPRIEPKVEGDYEDIPL